MNQREIPVIFKKTSDVVDYCENNSEVLNDLNNAISALYALDVGALSAHTLNNPNYPWEIINTLHIDVAKWASKLEAMRSLLFGDGLNWQHIQEQLANIPNDHPTPG